MRVWLAVAWALSTGPVVALFLRLPRAAWPAMLAYHAGCAIAATAAGLRFGPRPRVPHLLAWAVAGVLAVIGPLAVMQRAGSWVPADSGAWVDWGLRPPGDVWLMAYYVAVNPMVEERFWRAALLGGAVGERLGRWPAELLAAAGFVPFHVVVLATCFGLRAAVLLALPILGASTFWVWLYRSRKQAWSGAAGHLGVDLGLAAAYLVWLRAG